MNFKSKRPSPSFVISCVSLFVALSGTAVGLAGKNTVDSGDIKNQNVKSADIKNDAVGSSKVAPDSLGVADIATDGVGDPELGIGAVTSDELGGTFALSAFETVPANGVASTTEACPPGSQLITGGAFSNDPDVLLADSAPDGGGASAWLATAHNFDNVPRTLFVVVHCLDI